MNKKPDTTQPDVPIMHMAFFGKITLRDIGASGINDISVVVTGNDGSKQLLTMSQRQGQQQHDHAPSERMQEECEPSTETQEYYTFNLSPAEPLVPRVVPYNAKEGQKYTDPWDGCKWSVQSRRVGSGDLVELTIRCKGTYPPDHEPKCPRIGDIETFKFHKEED